MTLLCEYSVCYNWMGCSSSAVALVTSSKQDVKPEGSGLFTIHQKVIINRTWARLSDDPTAYGTKVFLYLFSTYPFLKNLFPVLADLDGDDLVYNSNFKAHATRFMQSVSRLSALIYSQIGVVLITPRLTTALKFAFLCYTETVIYIIIYI